MLDNDTLTVARSIVEVRRLIRGWRSQGLSVGLVPTMGSLHAGHVALVDRARAENDRVLATVFVNPLQFGPAEDFAAYPRDEARDCAILRDRQCDAVFSPPAAEMFPDGTSSLEQAQTRLSVTPLSNVLCGASRPGHFDGVATIVLKLLMITLPDVAYFGEKDYQQLTIIRRFVDDLSIPVRISGVPIVREPDGLALSSRNVYLTAAQRAIAPAFARGLVAVRAAIVTGQMSVADALVAGRTHVLTAGFDAVDYLTLATSDRLQTLSEPQSRARVFGAVWLGRTRLIDNIALSGRTLD